MGVRLGASLLASARSARADSQLPTPDFEPAASDCEPGASDCEPGAAEAQRISSQPVVELEAYRDQLVRARWRRRRRFVAVLAVWDGEAWRLVERNRMLPDRTWPADELLVHGSDEHRLHPPLIWRFRHQQHAEDAAQAWRWYSGCDEVRP